MADPGAQAEFHEIAFEAFGVRSSIRVGSSELLERTREILPPGWEPRPAAEPDERFELTADELGRYSVAFADNVIAAGLDLDLALGVLDAQLRLQLGVRAPELVFVHAGVVGVRGRAVVLPGRSFAGKTTFVAALVRRGATYYSDEFAILDAAGHVRPYARPLGIRSGNDHQTDQPVSELGGAIGEEPLPVGAVVITSYRAGAEWKPKPLTAGEGAMVLLANAVTARERPARVLAAISTAVTDVLVIESERGEADDAAAALLTYLDDQFD